MKKLAFVLLLIGCRHAHLGPDTGLAYHAALDAQRSAERARTPAFSATDANVTLAARKPAASKPPAATIISPMPAAGGESGGATWGGASGNISLEAK